MDSSLKTTTTFVSLNPVPTKKKGRRPSLKRSAETTMERQVLSTEERAMDALSTALGTGKGKGEDTKGPMIRDNKWDDDTESAEATGIEGTDGERIDGHQRESI